MIRAIKSAGEYQGLFRITPLFTCNVLIMIVFARLKMIAARFEGDSHVYCVIEKISQK